MLLSLQLKDVTQVVSEVQTANVLVPFPSQTDLLFINQSLYLLHSSETSTLKCVYFTARFAFLFCPE